MFITSLGGTGEGVSAVKMFGPGDEAGFAKDLGGGYVAFGKDQGVLEAFKGAAGSKGAHVKALGTVGNRVADAADIVLIANFPELKEEMEQGVTNMKETLDGMAQMMPDGGQQLGAAIKMITSVTDAVVKDGQIGIIGLGIDAKGVNLDLGANFKEGSESAGKFVARGTAAAMTGALPSGDFLFAGSFDWSSPAMRGMLKAMNDATKNASPLSSIANMSTFADQAEGYSYFIGAADLGAGLFANSGVVFTSKDPKKLMGTWKGMIADANGKTGDGMTFTTEFKDDAKEIAGLKAASYSVSFDLDQNNPAAGQMQMVMPMIFGPEGKMQGYTVATEKATITTLSRNSALMERLVASSKGGPGIGADALVQQTSERLPADRFMDGYIGVKSVMDMVQGAMTMFGAGAEIHIPEKLAPVGMGAVMSGGGVQFRIHVPNDVIKTVVDVSKQFRGGQDEDGVEPMGGDEKPRF
jgi:hypothetical protein